MYQFKISIANYAFVKRKLLELLLTRVTFCAKVNAQTLINTTLYFA